MGSFYKFEKSTDFLHKLSNSISAISHNITILVVPTSTIHACALEVLSCMSHILVFMRKSDAILDCLKLLMCDVSHFFWYCLKSYAYSILFPLCAMIQTWFLFPSVQEWSCPRGLLQPIIDNMIATTYLGCLEILEQAWPDG